MRTSKLATAMLAMFAMSASVLVSPVASSAGRKMLAQVDSPGQTSSTAPTHDTGFCGELEESPCHDGCAAGFEEGSNGRCMFEISTGDGVHSSATSAEDESSPTPTEHDIRFSIGRSLSQLRRAQRDQRPKGRQGRSKDKRKRAPRNARPADPPRRRTGKRAPRRARPADPPRRRTETRTPSKPVRRPQHKRSPAAPTPARTEKPWWSLRWPTFSRTGKQAPSQPTPPSHRLGRRGGVHDKRRSKKGYQGKAHDKKRRHGKGRRNLAYWFRQFRAALKGSHHVEVEGEGEGEGSTVFVEGDVGTLFVTSSGNGFIGIHDRSGQYGGGGQYGGAGHYGGVYKIVDPAPYVLPHAPHPQH